MQDRFAICGKDLTRLARLIADRKGLGAAVRLLVRGFEGMTVRIAKSVINGDDEIIGSSADGSLLLRSSATPLASARDRYRRTNV